MRDFPMSITVIIYSYIRLIVSIETTVLIYFIFWLTLFSDASIVTLPFHLFHGKYEILIL